MKEEACIAYNCVLVITRNFLIGENIFPVHRKSLLKPKDLSFTFNFYFGKCFSIRKKKQKPKTGRSSVTARFIESTKFRDILVLEAILARSGAVFVSFEQRKCSLAP